MKWAFILEFISVFAAQAIPDTMVLFVLIRVLSRT